jgi:ubiquinone/menaquinone biosynthesis C-methylase UbiE
VTFEVPAEAYDAFMGRYSRHLASQMADLAGVAAGQTVLDVGCGPGALATELAARVGPEAVTAVDPSEHFVLALRSRIPGVNVQRASGENLPLPDDGFDASFAQLVVHFMDDPVAGLREMGRVTKAGGSVAACVWDHAAGGRGPLSVYYQALHEVDPSRPDESGRPGTRRGHLAELFRDAGFADLDEATFTVRVEHESFEEWWAPYELGVGTISGVLDELGPERVAQLRGRCRELLPEAPFTLEARAWAVRAAAA